MSNPSIEERLWARIDQRDPEACWPWLGTANARGYPKLTVGHRKEVSALRLLYQLTFGDIPPKHWVHHRCNHLWCMNPAHLYISTHTGPVERSGAASPNAKLTEAQAQEILAARGTVTAKMLAAQYGVSPGTVGDIWSRRIWKGLEEG